MMTKNNKLKRLKIQMKSIVFKDPSYVNQNEQSLIKNIKTIILKA